MVSVWRYRPVHIVNINGLASSQESDSVVFFKPDQKGTVHLKHHENHLVVVFSVADYSQLGDVEYMYQMKGLDDKWYDTNGSDEVTFRNLLASRRKLAELVAMRYSSARVEQSQLEASADGPVLSPIDQDFLDRFNQLIDDHLDKEDLDMVFLTDKMAMSHSTLYRKVKALTGMTVNEYVRKQKLHRTMALLRSGKYNVTEAAMMAGFNNMGHFRDSFKKEFGITPSEVLKNR